MSLPFGGSKAATMLNMAFCLTPVFPDINPLGSTIRSVRQEEITVPLRSMVTTSGGTPLMYEANDEVVSVASQICLKGPDYHRVDFSHFEVLIADPVIDLAHDFLFFERPAMAGFQSDGPSQTVSQY